MLKPYSGIDRSRKLNFEYLIGQVMQRSSSGSSQPATSQLSDPTVLAALLLPHIQALASKTYTRFLILYFQIPNLETTFELRKLLGSDLVKVAGILDSLASDSPSMSCSTTPLSSNPLSNDAVAAPITTRHEFLNKSRSPSDPLTTMKQQTSFADRQPKTRVTPFAKADFVIPSTATDVEVTDFLSGICQALGRKLSLLYT